MFIYIILIFLFYMILSMVHYIQFFAMSDFLVWVLELNCFVFYCFCMALKDFIINLDLQILIDIFNYFFIIIFKILYIFFYMLLLIFFTYIFTEGFTLTYNLFLRKPFYQPIEQEVNWVVFYRDTLSFIARRTIGVRIGLRPATDDPITFNRNFFEFNRVFYKSLLDVKYSHIFRKRAYGLWRFATFKNRTPAYYDAIAKPDLLKNRTYRRPLSKFFIHSLKVHNLEDQKRSYTYVNPDLSYLDAVFLIIFFKREYMNLRKQQQLSLKLDKLKNRLGDRLYLHLSEGSEEGASPIIRIKQSSTESFKDVEAKLNTSVSDISNKSLKEDFDSKNKDINPKEVSVSDLNEKN